VGHDIQEYFMPLWASVNPNDGTPLWYTDETHSKTTGSYNEAQPSFTNKSGSPKYFGSLTNTVTYKRLSLQLMLYYNFGNYIFVGWNYMLMSDGLFLGSANQLTDELSAWQKPGDKTDVPQIIYGGNNNSNFPSTRFLYKGDYIRLRNVELSYSMPGVALKRLHMSGMSIYVRGTNLLTFVEDKHLPCDPELGITSNMDMQVFIPKSVTAGIKINL
jgi:hypothetical protein